MKVGSKDAGDSPASFALLFVKNYAILDLSDKISAGEWWIPKCCLFAPLKSDNAQGSKNPLGDFSRTGLIFLVDRYRG